MRAHYGDGSSEAVTFLSALASRDAGVAAVQGNAVVAVAPGMTDVTATYGGQSANAGLAVNGVGAGWIELLGLNLAAGQVALDWYATPSLGLTNVFTVYACSNLVDGTWDPVSPELLGHPSGFMRWAGGAASNTPVFYGIGISPR